MNKYYQKECESSCDSVLPDYMGDIKKVLSVSASAIPSGKIVGEDAVVFSGAVYYDVTYSDSEGKLTKLTATSDYEVKQNISSEGYIDSAIEPRVSSVSVRLGGPRKLSARASISCGIRVSSEDDLTPSGDAFSDDAALEVIKNEIKLENISYFAASEREYAEEAEKLLGVLSEDVDVISTSGSVNIFESEPREDGILVRGEIVITSIIKTDEQPPFAIKKSIPFEELVTVEGAEGGESIARGYLASVSTGVADDDDGARITASAILELYGMVGKNKEVSVMRDAYLPNRDTAGEYSEFSYDELIKMGNLELSVESKISRDACECENMREVLSLCADVKYYEVIKGMTDAKIEGELSFVGVACEINEESTPSYIPLKFSLPFSANVNLGCQIPENSTLECKLCCGRVDTVVDAEMLNLKTKIGVEYHLYSPMSVTRMTSCSFSGEAEYSHKLSEVKVYYPEKSESLFEVAKKFHTTPSKIAADNNLSVETSLTEGMASIKKLIIR